ncbi:acyltransferase [Mycolicibacterium flavescens]|uniref:Acyltransferase n=1 Tax=Mycolicibacterium flavescens TaxID=1776 RepID=A0A1E3RH35_MYCFV|nr:acyltransferase [Mycolicibacterium flavescens]MCV7283146.1 acyltransferase [Mycolicibacterium flavescens]ODQ89186.1 acyltransferase [Mycolicibacterium flavescens]
MTTEPRTANTPAQLGVAGTRSRIIGLDGARGLSCLGVAIMHVTVHYSPDSAAAWKTNLLGLSLIFFYALSGFLLFLPYARNLCKERSAAQLPSTRNFTLHRIARILPGYLAIFLLVNFVLQASYIGNASMQPLGTEDGTGMITDPWQLLANLTLMQSYFPQYFQTGLNPSWSLTLEYAFYASLPILGVLLFALRKRTNIRPLRLALLAPLILIVIGFVGRAFIPLAIKVSGLTDPTVIQWGPNWVAVFTKCFLTNADTFAFGMIAAVVVVAMEEKSLREQFSRRVRMISVLALFPTTAVFLFLIATANPYATSGIAVACGLAILIIVAPLARGEASGIARFLDTAPLRFVGKVSLSAYLLHFPLMIVLGRWGLMAGDSVPGMLQNVAVVLAVTLAVSTVTYYLVEQPAMNWAKRYRARWA